jgi:hypothetical protein
MPHLVVIDKDGRVLTKDGVTCLSQDVVGKDFPWRPKRVVDLLPAMYVGHDTMERMDHLNDKYLLLYFSAHSDALSKEFTPWLVKAYKIMKKKRQDFEVSIMYRPHVNAKASTSKNTNNHPQSLLFPSMYKAYLCEW